MISIVLYGRNDSYGYNLPRRAALSLNCMAEVLTGPDDELLFVDYNTPDDLPTFPEAIADTLTKKAKERLRIFRVRPDVHERYRSSTHLLTVEPVARNVAVRRANENNPWILSTNTDMIFVPRGGYSLTDVARSAAVGWYGIPRFELPEGLWESFDRLDAAGTIAAVRHWAAAAHLNEIVYGPETVLFDGPGDFQLIRREDLFGIDGFDEAMLLGWHVDSNIAKRLSLVRGPVRSLIDRLFGYHCGHTRQATPLHSRRNHPTNDWNAFVRDVTEPTLAGQRDRWGCVDEPIEEVRLATGAHVAFQTMLSTVLAPAQPDATTEAYNTEHSHNSYWYDASHLLPFLADLVSALPRRTVFGWAGVRRDTFELFRRAMKQLGFTPPILVPIEVADRLASGSSGSENVDRGHFIQRADVLIFEFGLIRDDGSRHRDASHGVETTADEEAALERIRSAFEAAVASERLRLSAGFAPRRFIAVNCIRTSFEPLVMSALGATLSPYSTRVRHGFVMPAEISEEDRTASMLRDIAERCPGIGLPELDAIRGFARKILDEEPFDEFDKVRLAAVGDGLDAFLELPYARTLGNGPADLARLRTRLAGLTMAHPGFSDSGVTIVERNGAAAPRLSKLAASDDWNEERWRRWAEVLGFGSSALFRTQRAWRIAQLFSGLERLGLLTKGISAAVAAPRRDRFLAQLAPYVGATHLIDRAPPSTPRISLIESIATRLTHRGRRSSSLTGNSNRRRGDKGHQLAVVLPGAAFPGGPEAFVSFLQRLDPLLQIGAVVAIADEVRLSGRGRENGVGLRDLTILDEALKDTGFASIDSIVPQVSLVDQKRVLGAIRVKARDGVPPGGDRWRRRRKANRRHATADLPYLGHEDAKGALVWPFSWFLRKTAETSSGAWTAAMSKVEEALSAADEIGPQGDRRAARRPRGRFSRRRSGGPRPRRR